MGKKVVIDETKCTACGMCETTCPEVFKLDEGADASRVLLPEGGPEEAINAAIGHCLGMCIYWED